MNPDVAAALALHEQRQAQAASRNTPSDDQMHQKIMNVFKNVQRKMALDRGEVELKTFDC
jgi:hypothetical protein